MRQLKARARELGVGDDAIEELDDAPDAKAAAIDLVRKALPPTEDELRAELAELTLRQLKSRAREAGASADAVDDLDDAPDARAVGAAPR